MERFASSFHCPLCHSMDTVTKVSSIVDGGSATSVGYHAAGRFSGMSVTTSMTALAGKLAPPSLPRFRVAAEGYNGCAVPLIILSGLCFVAIGWLFGLPSTSGPANNSNLFSLLFILFGLGFALYPIIGFVVVAIIRHKKRPRWEQARAIWERLYYCARNDVVYLPGLPPEHAVSPSRMNKLLYPPQA
ncbi:MAG TPA: hypothetical protein VFB12_28600 [Ktedonobacteraceae bacterium]|nr:hypothetical protein [Ktedonobacteraceae bacterium]